MRKNKGLTFVAVMIIIALTGLVLRFGIEQLIQWSIAQGESNARDTLRLVSAAMENYARDHLGKYPANLSALCAEEPPYIERSYIRMGAVKGYFFACAVLDEDGYACSAGPLYCRLSGNAVFGVTTGGSMSVDQCRPKEKQ